MRIRSIIIATLTALALAGGGSLAMVASASPSSTTSMLQTYSMTKKAQSNTPAENKKIRSLGGIAPCRHEDGSGQPLPCYWDGKVRGNGTGNSYIAMPPKVKGDDPRFVIIARG